MATDCSVTITDATHQIIKFNKKPERIITLMPSLAELVSDLIMTEGADQLDRIVGVSEYTDYPPKLKQKELIGPYTQINIEKILSLHPSVVFASQDGNIKGQIERLRELGLSVVVVRSENFEQVYESISLISKTLCLESEGNRLVHQIKMGIKNFSNKKHKSKKIVLQLGEDPLIVVGKKSFLNEAIHLIGAENVFGDLNARYPRPSLESMIKRNPDVIVALALDENHRPFQKMVDHWNKFPNLTAVKTHQIKWIRADGLLRPSIRLLEGLGILERAVYSQ